MVMATGPVMIVGAGGFGREVVDSCDGDWRLVDDDLAGSTVRGQVVLRQSEMPPGSAFVVAIADAKVREAIADDLEAQGHVAAVVMDRAAVVGGDSILAPGVIVRSHVSITTAVRLGRHVHVNINATVGHDCLLEDFVTVMPGAHLSGSVTVGRGTMLGTGAVVLQGVHIGEHVRIGAGAAVTQDVPSGVTAVGVPAKHH